MREFIAALAPPGWEEAAYWGAIALLALFFLLLIWMIIRMASRPRLRGRGNDRARLAITDAAEVGERRLVLLRRDDVEHLILIGGPNDLVIETDIRRDGTAGRNVQRAEPEPPRPTVKAEPTEPKPVKREPTVEANLRTAPTAAAQPVRAPAPTPAPTPAPAVPAPEPKATDVPAVDTPRTAPVQATAPRKTSEQEMVDEMAQLLDGIATPKRSG